MSSDGNLVTSYYQMTNGWHTLPVFTGREHRCHFGIQWFTGVIFGHPVVNDVVIIFYLQDGCPM